MTAGDRSSGRSVLAGRTPRRPARFVALAVLAMLMVLLGIVMVLSAASVQDLRIRGNAWHHQRRQLIWVVVGDLEKIETPIRELEWAEVEVLPMDDVAAP